MGPPPRRPLFTWPASRLAVCAGEQVPADAKAITAAPAATRKMSTQPPSSGAGPDAVARASIDLARQIDLRAVTVTERKASLLIDAARAFFRWGSTSRPMPRSAPRKTPRRRRSPPGHPSPPWPATWPPWPGEHPPGRGAVRQPDRRPEVTPGRHRRPERQPGTQPVRQTRRGQVPRPRRHPRRPGYLQHHQQVGPWHQRHLRPRRPRRNHRPGRSDRGPAVRQYRPGRPRPWPAAPRSVAESNPCAPKA